MLKASKPAVEEPLPPRSVMVRSLRRRLWQALQEEDVQTAMRAYTATKLDYERWIDEELVEEEQLRKSEEEKKGQKQKERSASRLMSIRKLGSMVKMESSRRLRASTKNLQAAEARKSHFLNEDGDTKSDASKNQPILQFELHPNDEFVRDDFYGPRHSYDVELLLPLPTKKKESTSVKPKRKGPRLAGFLPWRSNQRYDWDLAEEFLRNRNRHEEPIETKVDENMTTLLHEASRIASSDFVCLLLANGGNPNVRNGQQRTCLHMVAGGMLQQESLHGDNEESPPSDVGIRTPIVDLGDEVESNKDEGKMHKKAARAVGRLFQKLKDGSPSETGSRSGSLNHTPSDDGFGQLTLQRMDALLVVLSWVHKDDGTPSAGEGPSINSVDALGRTALHYAAEIGRTDVCLTILTSFGAILTVVDEAGQTPGELSAEENHPDLAAQLEARALLYADPYGFDEDLLANVWGDSSDDAVQIKRKKKKKKRSGSKLVPPFSWYETWQMEKVRSERQSRITKLFEQMKEALISKHDNRESKEFMYNHGFDDSMEEATFNSESAVAVPKTDDTDTLANSGRSVNKKDANADEIKTKLPAIINENKDKFDEREEKYEALKQTSEEQPQGIQADGMTSDAKENTDVLKKEQVVEANEVVDILPIMPVNEEELMETIEMEMVTAADALSKDTAGRAEIIEGFAAKPLSEFQVLFKLLQQAHVERFAAFHSWNTSVAVKAFQADPLGALNEAGVEIADEELPKKTEDEGMESRKLACLICCDEIEHKSEKWADLAGCDHGFCLECLGDYVSECARSKESGAIINCPHHGCSIPLSSVEIEKLSPSCDVYECLLLTSDENFVATAEDVCFCPHPGCEGVVRRFLPSFVGSARLDRTLINLAGAVCTGRHNIVNKEEEGDPCPITYEGLRDPNYTMTRNAIQPKRAHRFCFSCGSEKMHWPVQCDLLEQWNDKIAKEIGELDEPQEGGECEDDNVNFNDVAQRLWMKANTRPCPKCKAPIEKNDGCNHMTCSNRSCRHEFCWICREDWKLHNTETGGFFRCNRWQDDDNHKYYDNPLPPEQRTSESTAVETLSSPEVNYGTALHSSRVAWKKSKEMGLFLHHYRRWTAHRESAALESRMADTACARLAPVVEAAIAFNGHEHFDFGGKGLSFIHSAFFELMECRSLLQHSYAFAFFRYPIQYHMRRNRLTKSKEREKQAFEQLQAELEMLTEQTSDIVARKHLRATQMQIMFLTNGACQKRSELTSFMLSLLNEQIKENKEEAERIKKEKSRPLVDRIPEMGSLFHFPPRDYPNRHQPQQHREHVSTRLRRLMDSQHTRRSSFDDSDEDDDYRIHPGRTRNERGEADAMQDALQASVQAFFHHTSDDIRNDDESGRFQDWACGECTYMNAGGRRCAMCGTARR